jgi:hypothetical protein
MDCSLSWPLTTNAAFPLCLCLPPAPPAGASSPDLPLRKSKSQLTSHKNDPPKAAGASAGASTRYYALSHQASVPPLGRLHRANEPKIPGPPFLDQYGEPSFCSARGPVSCRFATSCIARARARARQGWRSCQCWCSVSVNVSVRAERRCRCRCSCPCVDCVDCVDQGHVSWFQGDGDVIMMMDDGG